MIFEKRRRRDAPQKATKPGVGALRFDTAGIGHWDIGLIAFLVNLRDAANKDGVTFDEEVCLGPRGACSTSREWREPIRLDIRGRDAFHHPPIGAR